MSLNKYLLLGAATVALAACEPGPQLGAPMAGFGSTTEMNHLVHVGYADSGIIYDRYANNFAANVTDTVNFAFNSARLTAEARAILDGQYRWLQANPLARLQLAGHTDLVGGEDFNLGLGLRRAESVANYLVSKGVSANRLDTVSTFGESQPVVPTQRREEANRRVVTTVAGVAIGGGDGFDGRRADIIYTNYADGGQEVVAEE
ncbi:OmpA family protein [Pontivivens insulae]|uniref:Outer membrane lipoprotein Omp16 n=1 Tax=Pontivivens insulae TaxID=1639689 RepID=A0A2R8A8Q6_9RHOB|nr:OmpA family protein [Pontivivens insulae]RED18714.1 OmpA family protein [Pontivivens insulae]SPF28612.1 Outer membrane lipoprotein Omp16 [Pontivivens insulae]